MTDSKKPSPDLSNPRVREWINEEYRRVTIVPIATGKVAVPPVTPSWDRFAPRKQELRPERTVAARRSMVKRPKSLLTSAAGTVFIALLILIPLAALYGVVWLTAKLYPLAAGIAVLAALALILVLLPAALLKRNRHWCGMGVTYVSYAWGMALWMFATLVLYNFWGIFGLILGFVLLGVGSVPLACLALLFAARFKWLGLMLLGVALVFAVRFLGAWIASEAETDSPAAVVSESLPYRWGKCFAGLSAVATCVYVYFAFAGSGAGIVRVSMAGLAVLAGLQALGLWKKKRFGLTAFLILCIVTLVDVIASEIPSLNWGESGGALGPAVLYLGSLPYFLKRRSEFGRNQHSV